MKLFCELTPFAFQDFHRVIFKQSRQTNSLGFGLVILGHRVKDLEAPDLRLDVNCPVCGLDSQGEVYLLDSITVPS